MNRDAPLDKVEWRVDGRPFERDGKPVSRFVPYLGATTVAAILDEAFGVSGWSDSYRTVTIGGKEALECTITVELIADMAVSKADVGVASNFEPQKGAYSDAFKRCASIKWGCGRNVYDLPTITAPCRIQSREGKDDQAWPTAETMPSILAQLKRLGYDTAGGRTVEPDPDPTGDDNRQQGDHGGTGPPDPDAWFVANGWQSKAEHDEYRKSVRQRVAALNDEARRQLDMRPQWVAAQNRAWDAVTANTVEAVVSDLEAEAPL